ncbi:cell wall metabolism sensor histidine kinase WalK [Nocardioides sp.]|uniref:sensor histidine kinase n=1 Tax=Nocardioides sp. TaxID=35761 RepID=UPI0027251880|nr:ATP-binding protein [Nocardioides sp.]MDO9457323.1 ATP-binding protein [Nocardioides sp.]
MELARVVKDIERERLMGDALLESVDVGLVLIDGAGAYERMNRRHHDFLALAYPEGHRDQAGQVGLVYSADGVMALRRSEIPSSRAVRGEEFDDYRIWVGDDPLTRRALAVSARSVRDDQGVFVGAALAYVDITVLLLALQVQQTFLASVSHELRTPLTPILGHLELLHDLEGPVPEAWASSLKVIERNAARLERLVSDLLLQTQLQSEGIVLDRTETDLAVLALEAVDSASLAATQADVLLTTAAGSGTDTGSKVTCFVDAERTRQVLDNLIANAIKYTDAGGRVTVGCRTEANEMASFVVSDTGIGIAAEDLTRIFTPFYRTSDAVARQASGLGLGLGIVRAIVHAHGGDTHVDSQRGRGTTVRLQLPASHHETAAARPA